MQVSFAKKPQLKSISFYKHKHIYISDLISRQSAKNENRVDPNVELNYISRISRLDLFEQACHRN